MTDVSARHIDITHDDNDRFVAGTAFRSEARGADHVLQYEERAFVDGVRELTNGKGVDVVFDAVGRTTLRDGFRATRVRGRVATYNSESGFLRDLDPCELGKAGPPALTRPRLASHIAGAATVQRRADAVFAAIAEGAWHVEVNGRHTLDDVEVAHAALEARR